MSCVATICFCVSAVCLSGDATKHTIEGRGKVEADYVSKRSVKDGVELVVSLPKRLARTSAISVQISLANKSSGSIFFHKKRVPWQDWDIGIVDANGKTVAPSPGGKKLVGESPDVLTYGAVFMPMHSMETHTWLLDLSKCYDLKSEKYRLSVNAAIAGDSGFVIEVKDLQFEIVEGNADNAEPPKQNP